MTPDADQDQDPPEDILPVLSLSRDHGNPRDVPCEVVRHLTAEDLPSLPSNSPGHSPGPTVQHQRFRHQQLAMLLSRDLSQAAISTITGYSIGWINRLLTIDVQFQDLVSHYRRQPDIPLPDLGERFRTLGISTIEELQQRLDAEPEKWSKRELIQLAELTVGPTFRGISGLTTSGPVTVHLNFVKPHAPAAITAPGPTIDMELTDAT